MNGEKPLVSILMTAYNREKFIGEAIDSVLKSTWSDFELIVVDDCSSDGTLEIANRYKDKDARIRVYKNELNLGDYHNRNRAAGYATGKYIKYVDSDDIIYPYGIQIMVDAMEQFPEAGVGMSSRYNQEEKPYPYALTPAESYHSHFYMRGLFDTGPSGLIFNAAKFREIGGFSGKRYIGDTEINLKMAARWPIVKIASSLVFWRQHEGQEYVAGHASTGYLELQLPMLREIFNTVDCPLSSAQKEKILLYNQKLAARQIVKLAVRDRKPAMAMTMYKKLSLGTKDIWNSVFAFRSKY